MHLALRFVTDEDANAGVGPLLRPPILWAALHGHHTLVAALRDSLLASTVQRGLDGLGLADLAALGGTPSHMRCLVVPHMRDLTGSRAGGARSTLHQAVHGRCAGVVRWVLGKAPELVAHRDADGLTPFALACALGELKLALLLAGDSVDGAARARAGGTGRVLNGRWVLGCPPLAQTRGAGGHTPLTLAVRVA